MDWSERIIVGIVAALLVALCFMGAALIDTGEKIASMGAVQRTALTAQAVAQQIFDIRNVGIQSYIERLYCLYWELRTRILCVETRLDRMKP